MQQRNVTMEPLSRDEALRVLRAHEAEIRAHGVTRLALFGSTGRNEARPESDVDLLVDVELARPLSLLDWAGLETYFADLFGRNVEVTISSDLKPYARGNILAEAIEVFPQAGSRITVSERDALRYHPQRQRLQDILDAIRSIERNDAISTDGHPDDMHQAALEREVEIISNAVRKLPTDLTRSHPSVEWQRIGQIGEVLRYRYYDPANRQAVRNLVDNNLGPLKLAIESIMVEVDRVEGQ